MQILEEVPVNAAKIFGDHRNNFIMTLPYPSTGLSPESPSEFRRAGRGRRLCTGG